MKKELKILLILFSYLVISIFSFIVGNNASKINIFEKKYEIIGESFSNVNNNTEIIYEFLNYDEIKYIVKKDNKVTTECTISYLENTKNKYYYSFTGCKKGYISEDVNKLMIVMEKEYFCLNSDKCSDNEKFLLIK